MLKTLAVYWSIFNAIAAVSVQPKATWTYNLIEVTTFTSNPHLVDLKLEVVRTGRSNYGLSGFFDIKTDLYNNVTLEVITYRSIDRAGPYNKFPLGIEKQSLNKFMNSHYKAFIQASAENCCENFPIVEDKFEEPLQKRYITLNGCELNTDNLPLLTNDGYYKSHITISGPFEASIIILALIENDLY